MLADDGRLVFLDFGLMSKVRPEIMEAFAYGIQCVLNKDWDGLVQVKSCTLPSVPSPRLTSPLTHTLICVSPPSLHTGVHRLRVRRDAHTIS